MKKAIIAKYPDGPYSDSAYVMFNVSSLNKTVCFWATDEHSDPDGVIYTFIPKKKILSLDIPKSVMQDYGSKTPQEFFDYFYSDNSFEVIVSNKEMENVFKKLFKSSTYKKHLLY